MARKGGNKKGCETYKQLGHKQINKAKKAERHKKRMERFAQRKENGVSYKYDKNKKPKTRESNVGSNQGRHTDIAKWVSIKRKLNDYMAELDRKIAESEARKKKKEAV